MRLRIAVPILTVAASIMLAGLAVGAQAQDDEGETVRTRTRPRRPARLRAPSRNAPQAGAQAEAAGDEGEGAGAEGTGRGLTEFETGVEYEPVSPRTRVTFNLEDADLPDLVRLVSNMTGKRFIIPGKVRSIKATVFAPTEVTAAEAYSAFLSILEVNGLNVVPAGRYLKIVETTGIERTPIPTLTEGTGAPGDDRYVTRLQRLDNVAAEDVVTLLDRFKSAEGSITAYAPTNTLIITDTGRQIRRMMQIIQAIDIARTGEQVWIEPIHYANAAELAAKLQEIFPAAGGPAPASSRAASAPAASARPRARRAAAGAEGENAAASTGGPAGATIGASTGESRISNIIPDERTNSLIIIATERAYMRILEMIRRLDIPLEGEGRIHVHYVQHGDAEEIASTLTNLIGGGTGGTGGGGAAAGGAARAGGGAAAGGGATDLFEGQIRVTAHAPSNALVITSSLHDYAQLRRVIERLDAPRRQVFIEAVVMELSVGRSNTLGFSFHGGVGDFPGDGALSILGFDAQRSLNPVNQESLTGLALGVRGPTIENSQQLIGASIPGFGVVINALATTGDANVLSTPHIMAMDNVQAEITVGENIPLQTSGLALNNLSSLAGLAGGQAATQGASALAGLAGLANSGSVPRQDVGTTIRITPHVNEADEIRMEIEEEISERGATEGSLGVVSINRRMAKTEVMVRDQQTIVIGGLMRESVSQSESKIPILGDIPVLGALFRRTERQTRKTNLLLFLTPYIIRDPADLRAIFERKMRERQEFLDRYFVFGDHDYEPPVDYSRTRGLLAEIIAEIDLLEEERRLYEAAAAEPPPEHVPRPPVGAYTATREAGPAGAEGEMVIEPEGEEGAGGEAAAPEVEGAESASEPAAPEVAPPAAEEAPAAE